MLGGVCAALQVPMQRKRIDCFWGIEAWHKNACVNGHLQAKTSLDDLRTESTLQQQRLRDQSSDSEAAREAKISEVGHIIVALRRGSFPACQLCECRRPQNSRSPGLSCPMVTFSFLRVCIGNELKGLYFDA